MNLKLDIFDNANPVIQQIIKKKPDWTRAALKSVGYWMMQQIQKGIDSGAPGGKTYAKFFDPKIRRALEQVLNGRGKSNYPPMGKLKRAVKYRYISSRSRGMSVVVGWTSASAVNLGQLQQGGFSRNMSEAMRRAFDAAFAKLKMKTRISKSKTTISTPARDTINAMMAAMQPQIVPQFSNKFYEYLRNGSVPKSGRGSGRSYPVKQAF